MSTEAGFLAAIAEAPTDDAPKLIFADYLDERGRSDEAARWRSRFFYRCVDCLSVSAAHGTQVYGLQCAVCRGPVECMGRVEGDRLKKDGVRCACDFRCTEARGPICVCSCGGRNHGTGLVVKVVEDVGGVPTIAPAGQCERKAARTAAEWRAARKELNAEINALDASRQAGERLPYAEFTRWLKLREALTKVNAMRSHSHRLAAVAKAIGRPLAELPREPLTVCQHASEPKHTAHGKPVIQRTLFA